MGCSERVEGVSMVVRLGWVKPRRSWNLNSAGGLSGVAGKFLVFCMAFFLCAVSPWFENSDMSHHIQMLRSLICPTYLLSDLWTSV